MTDIKLFHIQGETASELHGSAVALEKSLQNLIEKHLDVLLGIRFLSSEYNTGKKHGGKIDSLGIDENGTPVIIEYKRSTNQNVINQGLFYLDWLMDHQAAFHLLVMNCLGKEAADGIDWSSPRLLCIAGGFTRYDEHAVDQMNRNIELIRYRRFGEDLLLLELVNVVTAGSSEGSPSTHKAGDSKTKTVTQLLDRLSESLAALYMDLKAYLESLGDDVQVKTLKQYVAFRRLQNFACVEAHPTKGCLYAYIKVDPSSIALEEGFTRDVTQIGHFGTGDLEITLRDSDDLERARPLLQASYEAS